MVVCYMPFNLNSLSVCVLCEPSADRFIVQFQAKESQQYTRNDNEQHNTPTILQGVISFLDEPSVEDIHYGIVDNIQRIGYVAKHPVQRRCPSATCTTRTHPYDKGEYKCDADNLIKAVQAHIAI